MNAVPVTTAPDNYGITITAGTLARAHLPLGALALLHLARQRGLHALILLLLVQQLGAQVRDLRLHIRIAARPHITFKGLLPTKKGLHSAITCMSSIAQVRDLLIRV